MNFSTPQDAQRNGRSILFRIAALLLLGLLGSSPLVSTVAAARNAEACQLSCCKKKSGVASCCHKSQHQQQQNHQQQKNAPGWQATPSCGSACGQIALHAQSLDLISAPGENSGALQIQAHLDAAAPEDHVSRARITELFQRPPPQLS